MVTSGQIRTFKSATAAELGQAQSLIMRGRTHAASGDYRLERIIAVIEYLINVGRDKAVREAISKAEEARGQALSSEERRAIADASYSSPTPPAPTQTEGQEMLERAGVPTGDVSQITPQKDARITREAFKEYLPRFLGVSVPSSLMGGPGRRTGTLFLKPSEAVDGVTEIPAGDVIRPGVPRIQPISVRDVLERDILITEPFTSKFSQLGGEILQERIEVARRFVQRQIPSVRKAEELEIAEAENINREYENLNKDILNFNKRFSGDLSQTQYNNAVKEQERLERKSREFELLLEFTKQKQKDRIAKAQEAGILETGKAFGLGLLSAPFTLASFGVGLVTRPKRELITFGAGLQEIPEQFKQAPFTTAGTLGGEVVGQWLTIGTFARISRSGGFEFNLKKFNAEAAPKLKRILESQKVLLKDKRAMASAEAFQILKKALKKEKKDLIPRSEALKAFEKKFRDEKIRIIEQAFRKELKEKGEITQANRDMAEKFMRDAGLREFEINNILAEISRREGILILKENLRTGDITKAEFDFQFIKLKNLRVQLARQLQQQRILESQTQVGQSPIGQQAQPNLFFKKVKPKTQQQLLQEIGEPITIQQQGFFLSAKQLTKQKSTQKEILFLKTTFKTSLTIKQRTKLAQKIQQKERQLSIFRVTSAISQKRKQLTLLGGGDLFFRDLRKPPTKPPTKPPKKPTKIKLPKGTKETKLVKALVKLKKQGVNVVVGQGKKQRIVAKNLPPFKALKFGRNYVDKNIAASFRLKKSGKKTKKKDIKPFNVGNKFRPSKRNVLIVVEKRKFRLDSPTEKRQIKAAPKRKSTKKLKRRKK